MRIALPAIALLVFAAYLIAALASASHTFACDFDAYLEAGRRYLSGLPIYGANVGDLGACGVYQYPPPFLLAILPFAALPTAVATPAWIVLLVGAFLAGVALMPVRREVRWILLLLAGTSWPLLYGIRIGQVTPILFLLFAAGWRWVDRPGPLGIVAAVGTVAKLQPILLFGWMGLTRRWRAIAVGVAVIVAVVAVGFLVGLGAWTDLIGTQADLSKAALANPVNVSAGATAYVAGLGETGAGVVQLVASVLVLAVVVVVSLRSTAEVGYLTAVVASQLISPILWDHYALVLVLPVAWLLERRQWWAILIPLSQTWMLLGTTPLVAYLVAFYVLLAAPPVVVALQARAGSRRPSRLDPLPG
jgi:hypothetical protein